MFGLIDGLLQGFLGKYGRVLLDILLSNSFVVCTIVVIYGAILIFAQKNLEKIGKKAKTLESGNDLFCKDPAVVLAEKENEFWEQLRGASQFPFIALSSSLFFYLVTRSTMNKLLIRYFLSQQHQKKIQDQKLIKR